jgi:serine protease
MRLLVILAAAALLGGAAHGEEFVPGRVIVKWRASTPASSPARRVANAVLHRTVAVDREILATTPTREATLALVDSLRANPDVVYAEPDYIRRRSGAPIMPSDPLFARQWALPMIHAPEAWSRSTGSGAVTVAIVDTGAVMHPELAHSIVDGYDFITDPTNSADGDGRDRDWTDVGDSTDQSSALHGTHVAGIIAAESNNGVGVAGLDWGCRLLIVRALGVRHGTGVDSDISDAIRWAAGLHVDGVPDNTHPASVINMSFGGAGYSQSMQDAIHEVIGAGAVVIAAAGNLAVDAKNDSPAGLDGVIAVGAVDPTGVQASYSNYGTVVALMAPGGSPLRDPMTGQPEGVLSTIQLVGSGFTYTYYAGTSQAAPFVSATVSLMKSVFPGMNASDARRILTATANPSAKCANAADPTLQGCGAGLLDVDAALGAAADAALAGGGGRLNNEVHGGFGCSVAAGGTTPASATGAPYVAWLVVAAALALAALRRRVL